MLSPSLSPPLSLLSLPLCPSVCPSFSRSPFFPISIACRAATRRAAPRDTSDRIQPRRSIHRSIDRPRPRPRHGPVRLEQSHPRKVVDPPRDHDIQADLSRDARVSPGPSGSPASSSISTPRARSLARPRDPRRCSVCIYSARTRSPRRPRVSPCHDIPRGVSNRGEVRVFVGDRVKGKRGVCCTG